MGRTNVLRLYGAQAPGSIFGSDVFTTSEAVSITVLMAVVDALAATDVASLDNGSPAGFGLAPFGTSPFGG